MATQSPIAKLPRPELSDPPNAPAILTSLTNALDLLVIPRFPSVTARNAAIPSPSDGQHAYLEDSDTLTYYSNSAGQWLRYASGGSNARALTFAETKVMPGTTFAPTNSAQDVPGCTSSFTTTRAGAVVKVDITADARSVTGGTTGVLIVSAQIDGVTWDNQVNFCPGVDNGVRATNAASIVTTVGIGSHTVKLRVLQTLTPIGTALAGPHTTLTVTVFE